MAEINQVAASTSNDPALDSLLLRYAGGKPVTYRRYERSGWPRPGMRSNRIVGWKTSDRCDTNPVLGALEYGIWTRQVRHGQLVHHSDRGSTYTSFRFGQTLADHGVLASMGSVGDSFDNALMENFFSTLKTELVHPRACSVSEGEPLGGSWQRLLAACGPMLTLAVSRTDWSPRRTRPSRAPVTPEDPVSQGCQRHCAVSAEIVQALG
ncbi:hypothetical protein GCM10010123_46180 [Pilimelia anulata]|uniref:Integrase catalytic domain-containing protein n=1 Tax=Pilimelia anulata TaxID=53371 RepID=A0A8J3BHT1_9ACTN|nr:DDE-type integrase/transposase/recombinase [Pilimelia anulata]GGK10980.1 hypothetical protein GCM10010123_46180 [Pilimelia anulata]